MIHEKARNTSHPNPKNWKKWRFYKNGSNEISIENATKKQENDKKIVYFSINFSRSRRQVEPALGERRGDRIFGGHKNYRLLLVVNFWLWITCIDAAMPLHKDFRRKNVYDYFFSLWMWVRHGSARLANNGHGLCFWWPSI